MTRERRLGLASLVVLTASLAAAPLLMPWGRELGLDFANLHAFQNCEAAAANPYAVSGLECHDPQGRPMVYPPLLYGLFAWTRGIDFHPAAQIWSAIVAVLTVVCAAAWFKRARGLALAQSLLLIPQLPLLFAVERGNNDIWVLGLWTLAAHLAHPLIAGVLIGISIPLKAYPVFAGATLFVGWILAGSERRRGNIGIALGVVFGILAGGKINATYWFEVLPSFTEKLNTPVLAEHVLETTYGLSKAALLAIRLPLVGAWIWAIARTAKTDPKVGIAGSLAISTFFSNVSYDYNLITVIPLLTLIALRSANRGGSRGYPALFLGGALAFYGLRALAVPLPDSVAIIRPVVLTAELAFLYYAAYFFGRSATKPPAT